MERQENTEKQKTSIAVIIQNIIFISVLIPLIIIIINIFYQLIVYPDKIPHIFGYKIFMIFDEYMDDSIEFGDLVFTKNVNPNDLQIGDIIAFRNKRNTVAIHKIIDANTNMFTMKTLINETNDTKYVNKENVEGILVYKIPRLGAIVYFIQQPWAMLAIGCVILSAGLVWIYIAQELDERDRKRSEQ